jgi:BirA family biotin operon repressor/biotin-[acetyl-CoA-carboxylase] ligase
MKAAILNILYERQGEYVSGEGISRALGISRMAVKKHIDGLKERGYEIVSAKRRGHLLARLSDVYDEVSVGMFLKRKGMQLAVHFLPQTNSTNMQAKMLAAGKRGIVVAAAQTGGKGRMGRSFVSAPGGVYFTYYCSPDGLAPMEALKAVFCAALAACRALSPYVDCGIKWTNDIYAGDKKVCGILCEMVSDSDSVELLLQGIGINVNNEIVGSLADKAASLRQLTGKGFLRAELLSEVAFFLERYNGLLFSGRFDEILREYKSSCITIGRRVAVQKGSLTGIAEDIDENGFLVVKTSSGRKKVISGDVSLI